MHPSPTSVSRAAAAAALSVAAVLAQGNGLPLPQAVVFDPTPGRTLSDARVFSWYHSPTSLVERATQGATGFSSARHFAKPSSTPATGVMPMLGWTESGGALRINGFFKGDPYATDTPWRRDGSMRMDRFTQSFLAWFPPQAGFTWNSGTVGRLNLFGCKPNITGSINEAWWDGSNWRYTFHTTPAGSGPMRMGPHSALWQTPFSQGLVYMLRDYSPAESALFCYHWNGSSWQWWRIEKPSDCRILHGVPVATSTGSVFHSVFVVGEMNNGRRHLLERRWVGFSWLGGWVDHGPAYYHHPSGASTPVEGLRVGAALAHWDAGGGRHVRVFCYDAPEEMTWQGRDGRMYEKHMYPDGSRVWHDRRTPPGTTAFATECAVVVDGEGNDVLHVIGRSNDGAIWHWQSQEWYSGELTQTPSRMWERW